MMRDAGARRESAPGSDNAGTGPALRIAFDSQVAVI
jgi:hypothetical protein